jgi:hypothetical protein
VRTSDGAPVSAAVEVSLAAAGAAPKTVPVQLYRGRGSTSARVETAGELKVRASLAAIAVERSVVIAQRPRREIAGRLAGDALRWDVAADVVVTGDVTIAAGERLVVARGARVLLGPRVNIDVDGEIVVEGTPEEPVLFTAQGGPWGGLRLQKGGKGDLRAAFLTGGGGDDRRVFGHSDSQPVVFAVEADLSIEGGGLVDNPGKGVSSNRARVRLRDVLTSRCDQGGEHADADLTVEASHFVELPDGDGRLDDDDNDGVYVVALAAPPAAGPPVARFVDTVFAVTEDDGIDHNGATILAERVWIERVPHEGVAASTGGRVTVRDSVITRCQQGIEAGYGAPEVVVEHSLLWDNGVGLRWGDEYPTPNEGKLTARFVAVGRSREANVRNRWDGGGGQPKPDAVDISCSMVSSPEWDGKNGNLAGTPSIDGTGCVRDPRSLPGCEGVLGPRSCR